FFANTSTTPETSSIRYAGVYLAKPERSKWKSWLGSTRRDEKSSGVGVPDLEIRSGVDCFRARAPGPGHTHRSPARSNGSAGVHGWGVERSRADHSAVRREPQHHTNRADRTVPGRIREGHR